MMKFSRLLLAAAVAVAAGSCAKKPRIELQTVKAERGDLSETVTATGTVESVTQVDVGTQVTGIIDKLYADYNSVVTKGQLIAEIEKTMLESDLRSAEVGQTVVSSMNVANLYTIADLDNMQVIGNVDEADIGQVKMGQAVTFSVDAYPDDLFHGTVTQVRLNPTTESNVVTYEVVVGSRIPTTS